jgi:hypothetical protein
MLPVSLDCPLLIATMDNPETLAIVTTQDEENTEGAINNGQSRDTGNIGLQYYLRLVWPMLPVSLDCPLLIAPSVFSSSCVANVSSVSGLSIVDCPWGNQQWTMQRHWQHWPHKTKRILKGQSTMDNPETLSTLTTQDEAKIEGAINNGQSRDTSSCVANVASVSGLSIVDCPFGILFVLCGQCCQCLWIVHC